MDDLFKRIGYIPVLSLKPSEMAALEELSEVEKSSLLPLISLKKWANASDIDKALARVVKAFGKRPWIADIDLESSFINDILSNVSDNEKEVVTQFRALLDPSDGYLNWFEFVTNNEDIIPCLILKDLSNFYKQIDRFISLNKTIAIRLRFFGSNRLDSDSFNIVIKKLIETKYDDFIFLADNGDIDKSDVTDYEKLSNFIKSIHKLFPKSIFSVSGTSFPYSFGGSYKGEIPIYERQLFNKVQNSCNGIKLIYSDRASTRELALEMAAGKAVPRIDYPLKHDWRYIRISYNNENPEPKEELYKRAAIEIINSDYWIFSLSAWGRQMIEKTAIGDEYGISSPQKSTAVRVNLHLYQQIHYNKLEEDIDNEDDWED